MRAQLPGRAEFRPRRRDDQQRRLRAALGQRLQHVERGRIGPVQVLEREHQRLGASAGEHPGGERRELAAAQFLGRQFWNAFRRQRRRRSPALAAAHIRPRSSPTEPSAASSSASRFRPSTSAPPKRARPHSAAGCSGVFCNSCEDAHSIQVCGVSASRARNSSISRDLPRPGSPTISESWPSPRRARSQRRASRSSSSARPTSGVGAREPPRRPPPLARTMR